MDQEHTQVDNIGATLVLFLEYKYSNSYKARSILMGKEVGVPFLAETSVKTTCTMAVPFIEFLLAIYAITVAPRHCHGWSFTSDARSLWRTEQGVLPVLLPTQSFAVQDSQRRAFCVVTAATTMATLIVPDASSAAESTVPSAGSATLEVDRNDAVAPVLVSLSGDAKKLFNEGRALESQGNIAAAQRLYAKVTQMAPRYVYGWSNLGNTHTAFGNLDAAEESYTTAVDLCLAHLASNPESSIGIPRCSDLYVLLLNRGSLRLNNGRPQDALHDLRQSEQLRGRPDAIVLQNLARALEINGLYSQADRDYTTAISMTSNEVSPFWLRSALVKYQLGDVKGGFDLLKRVAQRFPEAPEVRAAYAVFLSATGDATAAQQKFLELPNRQRLKYTDTTYLTQTISWPPTMIQQLKTITTAVGDTRGQS
jgi:tetratricopeptide (TPR) repeat protein